MCRLHASITPFSIKDLGIPGFWYPQTSLSVGGSWNQSQKYQGTTVCVHVSTCTPVQTGPLNGHYHIVAQGGRGEAGQRGASWLPCSTAGSALRAGPTAGSPAGHLDPAPSPHPDAGPNPRPSWSESILEASPGASRVLPAPSGEPGGLRSPQDVRGGWSPAVCVSPPRCTQGGEGSISSRCLLLKTQEGLKRM